MTRSSKSRTEPVDLTDLILYQISLKDLPKVSRVLSASFFEDPGMVYYFPDEKIREQLIPFIWDFMIRDRIRYGIVFAPSVQIEGIAAWTHSSQAIIGLIRSLRAGGFKIFRKSGLRVMRRVLTIGNYIEDLHKRLMPQEHWYLSVLGVDPAFQGKGFASRLIRPVLERVDALGLPTYLETGTEENCQIYEHLGFEVMHRGFIPKADVLNISMIHQPA